MVPANNRRAYDVKKVLRAVFDVESFYEVQPTYAKNLVIAFARLGGHPVGIVANQPMVLAGTLDADVALAWPTAEICAMNIEGAVDVALRKVYEAEPDPVVARQEIIDLFRARSARWRLPAASASTTSSTRPTRGDG